MSPELNIKLPGILRPTTILGRLSARSAGDPVQKGNAMLEALAARAFGDTPVSGAPAQRDVGSAEPTPMQSILGALGVGQADIRQMPIYTVVEQQSGSDDSDDTRPQPRLAEGTPATAGNGRVIPRTAALFGRPEQSRQEPPMVEIDVLSCRKKQAELDMVRMEVARCKALMDSGTFPDIKVQSPDVFKQLNDYLRVIFENKPKTYELLRAQKTNQGNNQMRSA